MGKLRAEGRVCPRSSVSGGTVIPIRGLLASSRELGSVLGGMCEHQVGSMRRM